jgi:hypothetical protein
VPDAMLNVHRCEERRLRDLLAELASYAARPRLREVVENIGDAAELSDLITRQTYLAALRERDAAKPPATEEQSCDV